MGESTVDDSLGEMSDSALGKQLSLKVDSGVEVIYKSRRHVKMRRREYNTRSARRVVHNITKEKNEECDNLPLHSSCVILLRVLHPRSQ